ADRRKLEPLLPRESFIGLNDSDPARPSARVISGLAMNASVSGLASLRPGKLRLNDVTIEFFWPLATSSRFHWPMQGPHAFASTDAPTFSSEAIWPSRWIVSKIMSLPGLTSSDALAL